MGLTGKYILILFIPIDVEIEIGSLKRISFEKGYYAYVGSGGSNILKRIRRHFRDEKRIKWHIDYLTTKFRPKLAFLILSSNVSEYHIARKLGEEYMFIDGFGSSDSKYRSHLFKIGKDPSSIELLREKLCKIDNMVLEFHVI